MDWERLFRKAVELADEGDAIQLLGALAFMMGYLDGASEIGDTVDIEQIYEQLERGLEKETKKILEEVLSDGE